MSWRHKEDLGTNIVAKVHEQLKMADNWTLDVGRGFTYWASDYALTVSADLSNFHNAYSIFRLHSEIELAKGNGKQDREADAAIADLLCSAALSAITYDAENDLYKAHCSVYAHTDNAEWLTRVFFTAVGLQISRGPEFAKRLVQLGLRPAVSEHPNHGSRTQPDPMIHAVSQFIKPYGQQPSRWEGSSEWDEAHDSIYRLSIKSESDKTGELTAQFEWLQDSPIRLKVSSRDPHPEFGYGLSFRLTVPWGEEASSKSSTAMRLNAIERESWNWCHDLGSWCVADGDLAFTAFLPNVSFAQGALTDMAHDMALRAKWVNEQAAMQALGVSGALA